MKELGEGGGGGFIVLILLIQTIQKKDKLKPHMLQFWLLYLRASQTLKFLVCGGREEIDGTVGKEILRLGQVAKGACT